LFDWTRRLVSGRIPETPNRLRFTSVLPFGPFVAAVHVAKVNHPRDSNT